MHIFALMEQLRHLSEDQIVTGFVASCIESLSEREGCTPAQMWERMSRVNLIDGYLIPFYDTLHTESRENVTSSVLGTLKRWEDGRND